METRETRRQARRPVSGSVQVDIIVEAFRQTRRQAKCLSTQTPQDRNFAEGYTQALRDLATEADARQKALERWRKVEQIDWFQEPPKPKDDGLIPCVICKKKLTLESARKAAELWKFSLTEPDARQRVQEFWARGGAHSQARHVETARAA